jgi:hypothetical protein
VLALGVATLVLSGVFAIADGSLKLANAVSEDGQDVITHEAFLNFMERNFEQLPGNAVLDLTFEDGGSHYLSDLTFQNVPTSFSWSGQTLSAEAVQLSTVLRRDGSLDIVLRYYEEAILDDSDSTANVNAEPVAEITLLRNVFRFEWYAVDNTMEESDTWDVRGRLPLQMKLDVVFHANSDRIVHHFWLPPKANPETIVRAQRRNAPTQGQGPGGEQPGPDGNPGNPDVRPGPGGNGPGGNRPGGNRPGGGDRPSRGNGGRGGPPIPGQGGNPGGGGR